MKKSIIIHLLFCVLLFVYTTSVWAKTDAPKLGESVSFNFRDADIIEVINFVSELTGKNFLVDDKVRGKVTIVSQVEIDPKAAYQVFQSILEVNGFTVVPSGNVIKILPLAEAKQKGVPAITTLEPLLPEDRVITQLIQLKHVESNILLPVVKPMLSNTSFATSYSPANTLIITDIASNITKLLHIIEALDIEGAVIRPKIEIIELAFADTKVISPRIEGIFDAKGFNRSISKGKKRQTKPVKVIPYARTNSIILISKPEFLEEAKQIIKSLDVESPVGKGKINVYNLKNANSDELSKVLQNMTSQTKKGGSSPGKRTLELKESVSISSFKATNALIVIASPQDYQIIKAIIDQLDIRRPQVFVESMIMEVKTNKTKEFGIEWRTPTDPNKDGLEPIGGTNFGQISSIASDPLGASAAGLVIGIADGTFEYGGNKFINIAALLRALKEERDVNILSTPNILTTDNEEAEIMVGENIPVETGQSRGTGGDLIRNIKRQDVGLILRIKPQISESDYVKLNIYLEISSISPNSTDLTNPITSKRTAKTVVVVKDGQNIIIGGLVKDDITNVESKVPILGDMPLIGWLFKVKKKIREKTNLMIFISPHIIRTHEDIQAISKRKSDTIGKLRKNPNFNENN